ncbi:MAG: hypothetical protein NWF11_01020 [Candidatus Bathyarchaeota archaeon]|nr:hypothetical protein [Candidatus Bathyarchaeota archaeon]
MSKRINNCKTNNFVYIDYAIKGRVMKARIAVATVSGKAYYLLVTELRNRNVSFLSLTPGETIPIDIKAVITTKKEHSQIRHRSVLDYRTDEDPSLIVDQAIRMARGKTSYERIVVGVDPGQNFGVAVLEDRNILEAKSCLTLDETVDTIRNALMRMPARQTIVRIGNGDPSPAQELWQRLDRVLPRNVVIESVGEEGTSQSKSGTPHRRGKRDVTSAIIIGHRQGQVLTRSTQK